MRTRVWFAALTACLLGAGFVVAVATSASGAITAVGTTTAGSCPTPNTGTVTAHTLKVEGGVAKATVTVTGGCVTVGLASYTAANGQPFPANLPQTRYDAIVGVLGPGTWPLTINVPSCFAQTDLFVGDVIEHLTKDNAYGSRLLPPAILSGSTACAPVTTSTSTTTPTTSTTTTTPTTPTTSTASTPSVSTSTETVTETVQTPAPPPTTVTLPAVTTRGADHTVTVTKRSVITKTHVVTKTRPCPKPKAKPKPCGPGGHKVRDKHGKWHCAYEGKG